MANTKYLIDKANENPDAFYSETKTDGSKHYSVQTNMSADDLNKANREQVAEDCSLKGELIRLENEERELRVREMELAK